MRRDDGWLLLPVAALLALPALVLLDPVPQSSAAVQSVNPVRVQVNGHPANSGFLAFIEQNVSLQADESEGTIAMGGDLRVGSNYNVAAGAVPQGSTFTAPGDSGPTYLYVGGGIDWANPSAVLRVQNSGFTKIAGTDTYDAFDTDSNGADVDYRVVQQGAAYESVPRIEGVTHAQNPASVATPVPSSLIDVAAAFTAYRAITTQLAACAETISLEDANGNPLGPITPGSQAYFDLEPGVTNVLELSAEDLDDLSVLTFRDPPTATTPLLINVTGSSFDGNFPNLAGVSGPQAPYILWNFPTATSVDVTEGGATVEGTMYVPNGTLTWRPSQNIEGNVIATNFNHGPNPPRATPRELHDFPFAAELSCADEPTPTPTPTGITPTPTPTASPTPTPTPSPSPTTTPTETPSPSPSDSVLPASETLPPTDTSTVSSSDLPGTGGPPAWALTAGFAALAGGLGLATWARLRRRTS